MPNTTVRAAATGLPAVLIQVDVPRFGEVSDFGSLRQSAANSAEVPLAVQHGKPPRVFPDFSQPAAVDPVETERAMNAVLEALNAILAADVADMSLSDFPILPDFTAVSPTLTVRS